MKKFVNKKADFNYYFEQSIEAGIALTGSEIKSIREGKLSFKDSFARIISNEMWLYNLHISPYEKASYFNHDAERKRKLLLHKWEIKKLSRKVDEKGMTIVPREIYINEKGLVKVIIALAKGKHTYDKSDTIKQKDEEKFQSRRLKEEMNSR